MAVRFNQSDKHFHIFKFSLPMRRQERRKTDEQKALAMRRQINVF